jgi:hypothetical protein
MMQRMPRRFPVLATLFLAAACASTTIVEQWQSPGYAGGPFKRVLALPSAAAARRRR